jgi:CheY-like chemotaxis protein
MKHTYRILVVDDDPNARLALVELLGDEGYHVTSVADGQQARAKLDELDPHLILAAADALLHPDDARLLDDARDREPAPHIMLMSPYSISPERDVAQVFNKPIDVDRLLAAIERQFLRSR